ncbi:TIGR01777 family oxidoreductase [Saccharomonospora xinjiangensis]|uniref:TIGR01777 family protein n=1 Tax=Saccharomonospora xinjiangensis XJ-54 TaxID=882086 RepID=I0UZ81_9PSEU|nr:TIGR01777 family oxidoreductase [Saccharomonospora xinjiangensis]EID53184.1 TIGR01777 family protein [Saccharomonospora xinjiangensis XJ-54]
MRVLVAGSSGLIGSALRSRLRELGHDVVRLVRRTPAAGDERGWDPPSGRIDEGTFDGVDAVVNLCGAPLASGRWSAARKQVLRDSRIEPTEVLAEAVAEHGIPVLVNSSGISYYGDTGSREVDESAPAGEGFLPRLCVEWEAACAPAVDAGSRVILLRTAPVLTWRGGMLKLVRPVFRFGLGAVLGDGRQYTPWISLSDMVEVIVFCLDHDDVSGPVNVTAPRPVTNAEFTRAVGRALHRPTPLRMPGLPLRVLLGEAADEILLRGPRAVPGVLTRTGFPYAFPELDRALSSAR